MGECSPRIVIMPITTIKVKLAEYFILRSITTIKVKLADLVLRWSFRQSDWLCNLRLLRLRELRLLQDKLHTFSFNLSDSRTEQNDQSAFSNKNTKFVLKLK